MARYGKENHPLTPQEKLLEGYYGKYFPTITVEANICLNRLYEQGEQIPIVVIEALQALRCEGMSHKHNPGPKKRDRQKGQRLRKERTGSRRG